MCQNHIHCMQPLEQFILFLLYIHQTLQTLTVIHLELTGHRIRDQGYQRIIGRKEVSDIALNGRSKGQIDLIGTDNNVSTPVHYIGLPLNQ